MFFNDVKEIQNIASCTGCAVFVVPDDVAVEIKNSYILQPTSKTVISIDDVKGLISRLAIHQTSEQFIIIRPADLLGLDAANALLKNLEEPQEKVHFLLITSKASKLLPTILSRSSVYFLKKNEPVDGPINTDEKTLMLAKRLVVAKPADLPQLAEEMTKKKDGVRDYVLNILSVTIEMLYKSYFKTNKEIFLKKIPKFLAAYENISSNGHIKLHLVADLC